MTTVRKKIPGYENIGDHSRMPFDYKFFLLSQSIGPVLTLAANVNTPPSFSHQRGIHVGDLLQAAVLCSDSLDPRGGSLNGNAEQLGNRTAQIIHGLRERRTGQA